MNLEQEIDAYTDQAYQIIRSYGRYKPDVGAGNVPLILMDGYRHWPPKLQWTGVPEAWLGEHFPGLLKHYDPGCNVIAGTAGEVEGTISMLAVHPLSKAEEYFPAKSEDTAATAPAGRWQ